MAKNFLRFNRISYSYENSPIEILSDVSFHAANGWTGIVGANGAGKSTLLMLACGILSPNSGTVEHPQLSIYCSQRTDNPPAGYTDLFSDKTKEANRLISILHLQESWMDRWNTLSHGERKKVQLAVALYQQSQLLAIDEPTNHLDHETKLQITEALKSYNGIGLIVSHDRELLDMLCYQCAFVESADLVIRPGGITASLEAQKQEYAANHKEFSNKQKTYKKLVGEYNRRDNLAKQAKKKSSKRNISKKDHDAKSKIDLGRLTGKDATAGRLKKQISSRMDVMKNEIDGIKLHREYQTGIDLPGEVSQRNSLLNIASGKLQLGKDIYLSYPSLTIFPTDRIGITGNNGSGKSSLINYILPRINVDKDNITYIPQEIELEQSNKIITKTRRLPNEQLGKLMIIISRLGSDAKRVLETDYPSPGETRKLLLGLGILKQPHIIIMDEPTNHMDLISINCLEEALSKTPGALVLVSHDITFLNSLTTTEWQISKTTGNEFILNIT